VPQSPLAFKLRPASRTGGRRMKVSLPHFDEKDSIKRLMRAQRGRASVQNRAQEESGEA
jgi:hypothetical protein